MTGAFQSCMQCTHGCKSSTEGGTGGWWYDDIRSLVQRLAHAPICTQLQSLHCLLSQLGLRQTPCRDINTRVQGDYESCQVLAGPQVVDPSKGDVSLQLAHCFWNRTHSDVR